jgi:uncharacterized protein
MRPDYHSTRRILPTRNAHVGGEWPNVGLNVQSAIANGYRTTPINEYVIKLVGRCNLACDYCYVYTMADQSWRKRPAIMSREIVERTSRRIAEHALTHGLERVRVVLHGGEPLLAGPTLIDYVAAIVRRHLSADQELELSIQTNGVLLDERFMKVMHAHRIKVGLSMDGHAEQHDRNRKFVGGRGSHPMVAQAVELLNSPAHRELFGGLLCTIDLANDPTQVYAALLNYLPPMVDFLLPHATWSFPPPKGFDSKHRSSYGLWLCRVFDLWSSATYAETRVRLFEEIIRLLLGGRSKSDQVGLTPAAFLVVDTDGSLQQTDALKVAYDGAPETGLNVFENAIDDVLSHPAVVARQIGLAALADQCRQCSIVTVCGGGNYAHRYRSGSGFRHPSVYCPDLMTLIYHIARRIGTDLAF